MGEEVVPRKAQTRVEMLEMLGCDLMHGLQTYSLDLSFYFYSAMWCCSVCSINMDRGCHGEGNIFPWQSL